MKCAYFFTDLYLPARFESDLHLSSHSVLQVNEVT